MFGAQLVHLLCNAVLCVCLSILLFMNTIEWTKQEVTIWQHVHMQTFCMWDQGSEVDLLVHTKSRQSCACYRAAMINDRTYKESKGAS